MHTHLFTPISIGSLQLKNRMVVSAMVSNYCNPDGTATEKYIAYHEKKAAGGWGLIITEDYAIAPHVGGFVRLPGLWEDAQIANHAELTRRVHEKGGKICAQIYHAGRETHSGITGQQPVGPSALKEPTMPEVPRPLTIEEIHEIEQWFIDCAYRAKQAGFDAVEVHGAHGYLVGAFASPYSNRRTDEYGGSMRGRARFACEIIRGIKEKCGKDFPVLYRMSAVEYVPGGLAIEESKVLARYVEEAGADCIHCSQGVYVSTHTISPPFITPDAAYIENAAAIREAVDIPVIAAGRIKNEDIADSVIRQGKTDMVTMARASLADPELPNKAKEGRFDEIIHCIGCEQGCNGENVLGHPVRCLVNPITGMEDGEVAPTYYIKERFRRQKVDVRTGTRLLEIGDHAVHVEKDGKKQEIPDVDTVIMAIGVKRNTELDDAIAGLDCKVIRVGDANGVKNGYLGIREGFEAGLRI